MEEKRIITSNKRPTSFDVAREAGVSRSTVSLVINNVGGSRVSITTRERILKAAKDLGYQPNRMASALRKGYSNEIAMITPEALAASFSIQTLISAQTRAEELDYSFGLYLFSSFSKDARRKNFASIVAQKPIGIICPAHLITREEYNAARNMGIQAIVLQGFKQRRYAPTQIFPLKQSFYMAGKHLVERGHKRIAVAVPRIPSSIETFTKDIIIDALHSAISEAGGSLTEVQMSLDLADADATTDVLLSSPNNPTAIVGIRDEYCFFLLKAFSTRGVRVPQDVALVGIDDNPLCKLLNPTLTSVGYESQDGGANAVNIIDAIVRGIEPKPEWLVFPSPRLYIRESS